MNARTSLVIAALASLMIPLAQHGSRVVNAQSADPCAAAATAAVPGDRERPRDANPLPKVGDGEPPAPRYLDALWSHRQRRPFVNAAVVAAAYDAGDVAVMEDTGDLVIRPNVFDLNDRGIHIAPDATGQYSFSRINYAFRQPLGTATTLGDDDSHEDRLPFEFTFFGRAFDRVFINSDGNLTFAESDTASSDRSVTRLLEGPPRIAPFFADLDPSAGGRVLIDSGSTAYTVTWCAVPVYGTRRRLTVQVTLLAGGAIEIQSSGRTTAVEGVVGVSPGRTSTFSPVDLSNDAGGGEGALGEQFTNKSQLDTIATLRRFFVSHRDVFDNVVIFTDGAVLNDDAFAYEVTIANDIRGLNLQQFDSSRDWGSGGRLQSLVMMDALDKYPDDPHTVFFGSNSTVSVLGQEFGHRWLAFFTFRDANGRASGQLLGRDEAHWSFFMDSDASVMEGNDIDDLGSGSFRTVDATRRYSLLDQYAMGLIPASEVPPFFYVQNPTGMSAPRHAGSSPEIGVTFSGTRRTVSINDIIAIAGNRVPSAANSKREYRQAFLYVTSPGRRATEAELAKIDRIRMAWDQFVSSATDSRLRVHTTLSDP